jgi:two-component system cell cycle sensor histidine kinase/response regulator CckA
VSYTRSATGATILLAEDERPLRELIALILEAGGYQVLPAPDGERALQIASEFEGVIDLLLSDVMMPELDGPALARQLQAARPNVRTVLMSGYAPESIKLDETWDFLAKPIVTRELLRHVDTALGIHPTSRNAVA